MIYRFAIDEGAGFIDDRQGFQSGVSIGNLSTERCNLSTDKGRNRKAIVNRFTVIVNFAGGKPCVAPKHPIFIRPADANIRRNWLAP